MSKVKKIGVAVVFAIVFFDIAVSIIRNAFTLCAVSGSSNVDSCIDMATIWQICEPATAVIVCTLPAYRKLLPSSRARISESVQLRWNVAVIGRTAPEELRPARISKGDLSTSREIEIAQIA